MFSNIRLITFDAFNTLIKVNGPVEGAYMKAAKHLFPCETNLFAGGAEKQLGKSFRTSYQHYYNKYPNFGHGNVAPTKWWHLVISSSFRDSNLLAEEKKLQQLSDYLYEDFTASHHWSVFDDVAEVLEALAKRGIKLAVLSNFDERLPTILRAMDLYDCFDTVVCSGVCGVAKPDPAMFELVLSRYGVDAAQCLHVGDDLQLDYRASRAVGMNAVLVDRSDRYVDDFREEHFRVKSLDAILRLI